MNISAEIQRGLQELEAASAIAPFEPAPTFTWKNAEIPCTPSSLAATVAIDSGGNRWEIELRLFVRLDNFLTIDSTLVTIDSDLFTIDNDTPTPVSGRTLAFRGATYRIITARQAGPQSHIELTLADPNSNR